MSESDTLPASAEDRQKRIDEQTSVGRYTLKQIKQLGITAAGAVAGFFSAKGLLKSQRIAQWAEEKLSRFSDIDSKLAFKIVGTFFGLLVSGIVNAYGHWKNVESEKLAVSEVNQDVGHLVTERAKFAETLNRQEALIKDLVARGQNKEGGFAEQAASPIPSAGMARNS